MHGWCTAPSAPYYAGVRAPFRAGKPAGEGTGVPSGRVRCVWGSGRAVPPVWVSWRACAKATPSVGAAAAARAYGQHATPTQKDATCNMQCNMRHAAGYKKHVAWNMQNATCSVKHAACNKMQQARCNSSRHYGICLRNVQHAIRRSLEVCCIVWSGRCNRIRAVAAGVPRLQRAHSLPCNEPCRQRRARGRTETVAKVRVGSKVRW